MYLDSIDFLTLNNKQDVISLEVMLIPVLNLI